MSSATGPGRESRPSTSRRDLAEADEPVLWRLWLADADPDARAAIVERYAPYARSLAARLFARRAFNAEFEEYVQLAMVGLLESVDRYAPEKGAQFKTFATLRIQGAILNGLERLSERHQQAAARRRLAAERTASLVPESFETSPDERVLEELGDIGVRVALALILEGIGMGAVRREGGPDAYAQLEMHQVRRQVWTAVRQLPERERGIIEMHYERSMRFDEIARVLRLSKGRVSQLHRQAVNRLRELVSKAERCDVAY